jgi:chromosome segregation ATPase
MTRFRHGIAHTNGERGGSFWPGGRRRVALGLRRARAAAHRTQIKEEFMSVSEQIDALQQRAAELKGSADQARHETDAQIKARIDKTRADITARQDAVKAKTGQAADHAQSQWKSMKADAAARTQDLRDRVDRKRDERDAKKAEREAEEAEEDAADALDYALWVVDQAQLAVLDAIDARSWADARAAASPPS